VPLVSLPGEQRRVFVKQLLQAFDVVVVNEARRLCDRPLESVAEACTHFMNRRAPLKPGCRPRQLCCFGADERRCTAHAIRDSGFAIRD
jgi:hypothetical protein